ncbi:unnamed protein product [marine sediment metagenome]|uniref:Uncharacterized protein n=1 Tax=marine sediment metagenome TaxID=412755 RepID=X1IIK8_9ZZZZ
MTEQVVSLNPGESKSISFEAVPSVAKTYQVTVNGLAGSFKAIQPAPQIVIKSFHYVYKGWYTWSLPPIIHAIDVNAIGFAFTNNGQAPIGGVSVEMLVEWDDFIDEGYLVMPAGSVRLTVPVDQYWQVIGQPFIAPVGETKVWFGFEPPYDIRWRDGSGPPSYTITARVYVEGNLVVERVVISSVSYQ